MKNRLLTIVAIAFGILPMMACATIMKGGDQKLSFMSDPVGASLSIYNTDGMMVSGGKTPITLPLAKGDGYFKAAKYRVVFEAPGYEPKEVWISGSLEGGWYLAGNLVVGGWIGWLIVDPITGAMWNLKPSSFTASLKKSLALSPDTSLKVMLASDVSPELLAMAVPLGISQ